MFWGASSFNQDIGNWDTGRVTEMERMFGFASSFDQDIGRWNTSIVGRMSEMFREAWSFNQDIGDWDTTTLSEIEGMFDNASAFDQDLGGWYVGHISTMNRLFNDSGMSPKMYGATLSGWASQGTLLSNVDLSAWRIQYSCPAESSRQRLIDEHSWRITDGGSAPCLEVAPAAWDFGDVRTGQNSPPKTFTVSNTGTAALTVNTVQITGADPSQYTITSQTCTSTPIAPAATCTVTAAFNPTTTGTKNAGLTFTYDATGSPVTTNLHGTGTTIATSPIDPPSAPPTSVQIHQRPGNAAAVPPRRIRAFGTTVIAGPNALTNAEQVVLTRVKVRSTKAKRVPGVKVIRKGSGAVLVRAKGLKGVKIVVDQSAPAIGDYREYRKRTVYVNGRP